MSKRSVSRCGAGAAVAMLLAGGTATTQGAGYGIVELDAAGLGRAFAGQAAVPEAASLSFNPAAVPTATTVSGSLHYLSNDLSPEDAGVSAVIPALYGSYHGFGAGVYAPFGLSTDYPDGWVGRYSALHSKIESARVHVTGAYSVTDTLRLGAGVFLQRMSAKLTSAYPLGYADADADAEISVDGDDNGVGFSLGALWQPRDALVLGLSYSSHVHHELKGRADLPTSTANTSVSMTTPESVTTGLSWEVKPDLRILGGVTWTRWSRLQDLDIRLSNGLTLSEEHAWRDTWRLSLGAEHDRGSWTFRGGVAWDQSPIRDDAHRYPRLPDTDRTWLSVGVGYRRDDWHFDVGYAHIFFGDRDGEHPPIRYSSSTDILGVGLTKTW